MKLRSVEDLVDAKIVKLPGGEGKINCDESKEFIKSYAQEKQLPLADVDPRDHMDRLLADNNIPLQYRDRARMYLNMPRALIAAYGKDNIEETGEWRVNHWSFDHHQRETIKFFTSKEDCLSYIDGQINKIWGINNWKQLYSCSYMLEMIDEDTLKPFKIKTEVPSVEEALTFAENFTFDIRSTNGFVVENKVSRNDVPTVVQKAIDLEIQDIKRQFTMYKRLRPKGDETWGNWWKLVPII